MNHLSPGEQVIGFGILMVFVLTIGSLIGHFAYQLINRILDTQKENQS